MKNEFILRVPIKLGAQSGSIAIRHWSVPYPKGRIICFHGLSVSSAEFCVLAKGLNQRGYDVLCPDWIGHGDSTYFGLPEAYQTYWYLQCMNQIMKVLVHSENTHILSVSFGAIITFTYLVTTQLKLKSTIFVDLPMSNNKHTHHFSNVLNEIVGKSFNSLDEAETELKRLRPSLFEYPEQYASYFRENRFQNLNDKFLLKCDNQILKGAGLDSTIKFDLRPQLSRINGTSHYVYGNKSPLREPLFFHDISSQYPNITYSDDIDSGHPPCLLGYNQVAKIIKIIDTDTEN